MLKKAIGKPIFEFGQFWDSPLSSFFCYFSLLLVPIKGQALPHNHKFCEDLGALRDCALHPQALHSHGYASPTLSLYSLSSSFSKIFVFFLSLDFLISWNFHRFRTPNENHNLFLCFLFLTISEMKFYWNF